MVEGSGAIWYNGSIRLCKRLHKKEGDYEKDS